ncbi:hypothetical protein M3J09_013096 [Ascochyta lentis]
MKPYITHRTPTGRLQKSHWTLHFVRPQNLSAETSSDKAIVFLTVAICCWLRSRMKLDSWPIDVLQLATILERDRMSLNSLSVSAAPAICPSNLHSSGITSGAYELVSDSNGADRLHAVGIFGVMLKPGGLRRVSHQLVCACVAFLSRCYGLQETEVMHAGKLAVSLCQYSDSVCVPHTPVR